VSRKRQRPKQRIVWASQLAEMSICERRARLKARFGERLTPRQQKRVEEGIAAHANLHRQSFLVNPDAQTSKIDAWYLTGRNAALWLRRRGVSQPLRYVVLFLTAVLGNEPK